MAARRADMLATRASRMAEGSKAGAVGVLAVLGLGLARVGDDCARGGVRGAGALDDVAGAGAGSRMASWGPGEIAGAGVDDAARLGVKVDGTALPGLRGAGLHEGLAGAPASEGPWFHAVRDFGIDVGVDETKESFLDNQLQPSLPAYVRGFVERALTQEVAPVVIAELATVDGAAKLVSLRPGAGGQ